MLTFESCFLRGEAPLFLPDCFLFGEKSFKSELELVPLKSTNSTSIMEFFDCFEVTPEKETSSNGWNGFWAIDGLWTLLWGCLSE